MAKKLMDGRKPGSGLSQGSRAGHFQPGNPGRQHRIDEGYHGGDNSKITKQRRTKQPEEFDAIVEKELDTKIFVPINGRPKRMTKRQISAMQLTNQMVRGDLRAHRLAMTMRKNGTGRVNATTEELTKADDEIWEAHIERILRVYK